MNAGPSSSNQLVQILAIAQILGQLVLTGKTTIQAVVGFLKQQGATPEQLATLDVRLTGAIDAREAEKAARPPIE